MLDILKDEGQSSKIGFSHSLLPGYIDPQNVSTKKKPFCIFNTQHFSHTLDLILPSEIYDLICARLDDAAGIAHSQHARVYMKLEEVLQGDFFTEYIKKGNIMMLSEGRPRIDNRFELYEGVLRLELDRPTYERCGLQGKPVEDGGRKHQKARWVVEFDLRAPSMFHGKKGFGRLEWAAKNVLNQSLTWLFYNFNPSSRESLSEGKEPISIHQPSIHAITPSTTILRNVLSPKLTVGDLLQLREQEDAMELLEWIHLLSISSPRLRASDKIDPFLSKYEVPGFGQELVKRDIVRVRWRGFVPPQFVREMFLAVRKEGLKVSKGDHDGEGGTQAEKEERWFAMNVKGFGENESYTVMQWAGRETVCWEVL